VTTLCRWRSALIHRDPSNVSVFKQDFDGMEDCGRIYGRLASM
jgi:hypothetical protein